MLHRLGQGERAFEIDARHQDDEIEGAAAEEIQGRILGVGAGDARDRIEVELEVLAVDLLGEDAVRFHDEGVVEAPDEEDLADAEAHEIMVDVSFPALLIIGSDQLVEVHVCMIPYRWIERKRSPFLDLGLAPLYHLVTIRRIMFRGRNKS